MENTKEEIRKAAVRLPTDALIQLGDYLHFDREAMNPVEEGGTYTEVISGFWVVTQKMTVAEAMEQYPIRTRNKRKLLKVTRLVDLPLEVKSKGVPAESIVAAEYVGAGPRGDLTIRFRLTRKENAPWYLEINQGSQTVSVPYGTPGRMASLAQSLKTKLGWAVEDFDRIVEVSPDPA